MLNNFDYDFNKESKKKKEKHRNNNYENNTDPQSQNFFSLIISTLKTWFNSITFMVKQIVAISIILWIIDLFTINYVTFIFANVPYYSIGYFQIWRFITGNLITSGIFSLIFALIFWVSDGKVVEKMKGSARYLIYFLIHSMIIQIFYALIYYFLINKKSPDKNNIRSNGLWCYIILEVTINCLVSPESNIFLPFIPYGIKAKFFSNHNINDIFHFWRI
jgi:membrane associated rhomboid family serine protease